MYHVQGNGAPDHIVTGTIRNAVIDIMPRTGFTNLHDLYRYESLYIYGLSTIHDHGITVRIGIRFLQERLALFVNSLWEFVYMNWNTVLFSFTCFCSSVVK